MSLDYEKIKNHIPDIVDFHLQKKFSVAICLVEGEKGPEIVFEERAHKMNHQPGDICFPGGKVEEGETPADAAVREICEELLVTEEQIEILGRSDIYLTGKGRVLYPFVVKIKDYKNTFSKEEVEEIIRIPLSFFKETEPEVFYTTMEEKPEENFPFDRIYGGRDYPWSLMRRELVFYQYGEKTIWGMTGKMMKSFSDLFLK